MDNGRDGAGPDPVPHRRAAAHYQRHLPKLAPALSPALAGAGPVHHLMQCSDGVYDFTLDVLDAVPGAAAPDLPVGQARTGLRRVGEQLSVSAAQLDRRLAELRSGGLIRLVLQAAGGAFYCDSVVPGRYLIGTRFVAAGDARPGAYPDGQPAVDEGDRAMSQLVREMRQQVSLPSQDPGGFESSVSVEGVQIRLEQCHLRGDPTDPRVGMCLDALSPRRVNYLSYWRDGQPLFAVDVLDHDDLAGYATCIDSEARRRRYLEVGEKLGAIVGGLGRTVHPVTPGPLSRAVLDVEQGALFYFRIRRGEYLLGASLVQRQVSQADTAANQVADRLRDAAGGEAAQD